MQKVRLSFFQMEGSKNAFPLFIFKERCQQYSSERGYMK